MKLFPVQSVYFVLKKFWFPIDRVDCRSMPKRRKVGFDQAICMKNGADKLRRRKGGESEGKSLGKPEELALAHLKRGAGKVLRIDVV